MFDSHDWRHRQLSQFPPWLAQDLGLDASTIDAIVARPSAWSRFRALLESRRGDSGAGAVPQPLPVKRSDTRDDRAAA
jgi:hypothetical protein